MYASQSMHDIHGGFDVRGRAWVEGVAWLLGNMATVALRVVCLQRKLGNIHMQFCSLYDRLALCAWRATVRTCTFVCVYVCLWPASVHTSYFLQSILFHPSMHAPVLLE